MLQKRKTENNMDTNLIDKVNQALAKIRPYLNADGGDVSLIGISDDLVVTVKFSGACDGCPYSFMTLKAGVEQAIRKELPEVKDVVAEA
jgi:Fe-S cluster biogenesis protein NfuA